MSLIYLVLCCRRNQNWECGQIPWLDHESEALAELRVHSIKKKVLADLASVFLDLVGPIRFGIDLNWLGKVLNWSGLDLNWVGIDSNAFGIEFDWCCVDVGWTIVGLDWYGIGIDWFGLSVVDLALILIDFAWIGHGFPWMFVCFWLCFWWVLVLKAIHCNQSAYILNIFHCLTDLAFQNGFSAGA